MVAHIEKKYTWRKQALVTNKSIHDKVVEVTRVGDSIKLQKSLNSSNVNGPVWCFDLISTSVLKSSPIYSRFSFTRRKEKSVPMGCYNFETFASGG